MVHCRAIALAWLLLISATEVRAQGPGYSEYDVKAAFVANFTQFVKWPDKAFSDAGAPFTIGILGDDPFGGVLEKLVQGQTVSGHKIVIRRARRAEDLRTCQLVFISKSEQARIAECLGTLQGGAALTVGETDQFTRQGGMIGFWMEGNTVRFSINPGAAQRAALELSSRLRKLDRSGP
jgi:YfiR/HmsC-like